MNDNPNRRWFQFSLSTWLILVAILCWAMAVGPTKVVLYEYAEPLSDGIELDISPEQIALGGSHERYAAKEWNSDFVFPALAFFAFLAWKAVWRLVERRREKILKST